MLNHTIDGDSQVMSVIVLFHHVIISDCFHDAIIVTEDSCLFIQHKGSFDYCCLFKSNH